MAIITTTFNTVDKSLSVDVDGTTLDNVVEVYHRKKYSYEDADDGDDYCCSVTTHEKDEVSGIHTSTRLCASESAEGKAAASKLGTSATPIPGFVVSEARNKVHDDIASFFGSK